MIMIQACLMDWIYTVFCREGTNELLNDPFHNHTNKLLAKSARNAKKQAVKPAVNNPTVAQRRVLGDLSSNVLASTTPDTLYTMNT